MPKTNRPKEGDRITHSEIANGEQALVVDNLLSSQFVVENEEGHRWMIAYDSPNWRIISAQNEQ